MWWAKQARWERILVYVVVSLLTIVVSIGRPMVLTGQGISMRGPNGLRDGAREFCIPIRWWGIVPGRIYAFLDPKDGQLCLKRSTQVDPAKGVWFEGDNKGVDRWGQPESIDSRSFGWVSRDRVVGLHLFSLPSVFDGKTAARELAKPTAKPVDPETKQIAQNQARLQSDRVRLFVESGSPSWRKLDGAKIGDGQSPITIRLPEACKSVGILYGSSASAVCVVYTETGREVVRLRGVISDPQTVSAPAGERIAKVVLLIEDGAPPQQMGEVKAIRKIG